MNKLDTSWDQLPQSNLSINEKIKAMTKHVTNKYDNVLVDKKVYE